MPDAGIDYYKALESCCMGSDGKALLALATRSVHFIAGENDGPQGAAVFALSDGMFATFEDWEDYTGHG